VQNPALFREWRGLKGREQSNVVVRSANVRVSRCFNVFDQMTSLGFDVSRHFRGAKSDYSLIHAVPHSRLRKCNAGRTSCAVWSQSANHDGQRIAETIELLDTLKGFDCFIGKSGLVGYSRLDRFKDPRLEDGFDQLPYVATEKLPNKSPK